MKIITPWLTLFLIFVYSDLAFAVQNVNSEVRRYAVIAAANNGGAERTPLRYAESDALMVSKVFREIGGLESGNQTLLIDPTPEEVLLALNGIQRRVEQEKRNYKRSEVLFYYSGHSDDKGLLLGSKRLEYGQLKQALTGLSADVQIAVLDSCASGAFTRIKGGTHKPPFLIDESSDVKGYAFLTSSSADEAAQESDVIRGSYFTHYFVSALRGAGDTTQDKRVTLNEAYQYAFHETLARTEQSMSGAQHAAYDFKLAGAGDLVLTDLSDTGSKLVLEKELSGRLYVRDETGRLIVELNKLANVPMEISLPPQNYIVTLDKQGVLYRGAFTVGNSKPSVLTFGQFHRIDPETTVARGNVNNKAVEQVETTPSDIDDGEFDESSYEHIPVRLSLFPGIEIPEKTKDGKSDLVDLNLEVLGSKTDNTKVAIGVFASTVNENIIGAQASGGLNLTGGNLRGGQGGFVNIVKGELKGGQGGFVSFTKGNLTGGQGGFVSLTNGNLTGGQGGFVSAVGGNLEGGQGGMVAITGGDVRGAQGAGAVTLAMGNVKGGQGAGVINITHGDLKGGQGAGVINVAQGKIDGMQGAGVVNIAQGDIQGAQIAGIVNVSQQSVSGAQIAAVTNVALGDVGYAQIGLTNISNRVERLQLGLVNVANENNGIAFGLFNWIRDGRFDIGVDVDEAGYSNVFFKTGAKHIYNYLAVGRGFGDVSYYTRVRWGVGWTLPLSDRLALDNELVWGQRNYDNDVIVDENNNVSCKLCAFRTVYASLGTTLAYKIVDDVRLIAGISLNTRSSYRTDNSPQETVFGRDVVLFNIAGKEVRPGFHLGLQY